MAEINLVISARIEEVPILGRFTNQNYLRDKTDFETYKPAKYVIAGPGFAAGLLAKIVTVEAVVFPKTITAQLKLVTVRIETNMNKLPQMMDRLEGYVVDAVGLTVGVKDFGISPVRKAMHRDDQEGLDGALHYLLQNITSNMGALTAQGYTAGDKTALEGLKQAILDDNVQQNNLEEQRAQLRLDNLGLINDLCKDLKGIWADGKRLYKTSNKTRTKDYTLAQLKNRIRQEELKTELTGTVFNITGTAPVTKRTKVVAKPLLGGRSKTVYTDKNSVYDLKGLKPETMLIKVILEDGSSYSVTGEPVTREKVVLDLKPGDDEGSRPVVN